jgi:hypothetical protein
VKAFAGIILISLLALSSQFDSCRDLFQRKVDRHEDAGKEALAKGDYVLAEKEFKLALENLNLQWEGDRDRYVFVSGDLGKTYWFMNRDSEAEAVFRDRLKKADELWHIKPEILFYAYDDLAIFYLVRKRFDDAQPLYIRAIELREKAFGPNDPRVAAGLELYKALLVIGAHEKESNELAARAAAIRARSGSNGQ